MLLTVAAVGMLAACAGTGDSTENERTATVDSASYPQGNSQRGGVAETGQTGETFAGYGGVTETPEYDTSGMLYQIGDTGPAGGVVYYVSREAFPCGENLENLCNYLEASTVDAEVQRGWSDPSRYDSNVEGADATAIGTGWRNTVETVRQGNDDPATSAAAYADAYVFGGKDDWYLPSKDEFVELYRQRDVVGGFSDADYWSSSEIGATMAWSHRFNEGHRLLPHPKYHYTHLIRPVRAF
jgi:hypothetical protein